MSTGESPILASVRGVPCATAQAAEVIRVRGLVQGVGFRPTVWRVARECGLAGDVCNDGEGVLIQAWGDAAVLDKFVEQLCAACPPLARIDSIERCPLSSLPTQVGFHIVSSAGGRSHTGVVPDAVTCGACVEETFDSSGRRYCYPFTNCTHCGPRLSIVQAVPYDRSNTTMAAFSLCAACRSEYADPGDRRFHAQPIACPTCGPRISLEHKDGTPVYDDALAAACRFILQGAVVAIKGLGGFQLACDAADETAVARLRTLKHRERKPFALLARDVRMVKRHCALGAADEALLTSPAGPIVIMPVHALVPTAPQALAASIAPGIATLGFMLPSTPLHHMLMRNVDRPIVLTSGNRSGEPQCIDNEDARVRLAGIADYLLLHDREIARRVDDSVARTLAGTPRVLRRARGYAPAPLRLPSGFADAVPVLAMGGESKNTFCLLRDGEAIVSHHIGDLENALTYRDFEEALAGYEHLFEHDARRVAVDLHPEYLSTKLGIHLARRRAIALDEVQHHHAHLASCLAENGIGFDAEHGDARALGIVLDGLGLGDDGTLWGGEFLLGGYLGCERVAAFRPVALPGGVRALQEPWRNTFAHLHACFGWSHVATRYSELDLTRFLSDRPLALLGHMIERGVNSPVASSAGRLFDAVAAAAGVCRERALYEGQAAIELEALVDASTLDAEDDALAYPFMFDGSAGADRPLLIGPQPMWRALLDDLSRSTPVALIAARFHKGVALAIVHVIDRLLTEMQGSHAPHPNRFGASRVPPFDSVALSGGVMQNRVLFEQLVARLEARGLSVLTHHQVPSGDGGLSLGQASIAAARALARDRRTLCA